MNEPRNRDDWAERQERSNLALLRFMTWVSLRFGRRIGRVLLRIIAAYFVVFAPRARRASRAYLNRALGRHAGWRDGYRHVFSFASTIHDRIYLLNERFDLFDIRTHGVEDVEAALAGGHGAFLMGAHLGSFEVVRAIGRAQPHIRIAITMYEENARKINAILAAVNPAAHHDVIGLGKVDAMLKVRERLDAGTLVGILADRTLRQAGDALKEREFLGAPAAFPLGPLHMAAVLRRPVVFMTGLYLGGNRYDIHFETLADFSKTGRGERAAAVDAALTRYVALLEKYCRAAPYNWFNYFDFWQANAVQEPAQARAAGARLREVTKDS
ncbi:acyl-CoA synthetase [Caballeronia novacaledonica]|uniref:Acyl-CoA synthetase n=2 Tax=Caballeronia novacaledonica TaxID=1544861 RepID=A0AA37MJA5_9BURK|nr:acyl-CoA synthetase [Caballeronia novacaledonica]